MLSKLSCMDFNKLLDFRRGAAWKLSQNPDLFFGLKQDVVVVQASCLHLEP